MVEHGLLEDDHEVERVARRAKPYVLIAGELYRRRENGVKLRCISQEQGRELLKDIHGDMLKSRGVKIFGGKGFPPGILLANGTP